jgi:recombination protein RecA
MAKTKEENKETLANYKQTMLKHFGKASGVVVEKPEDLVIEKFSTGSMLLDDTLAGGYPKGMIIELFGDNASGKTTTAIHAAKEHQAKYPGEPILWIDLERVFDPVYNETIGLKCNEEDGFLLLRPSKGEDVYEAAKTFCKMHLGGLIVIDSVSLILPTREDEGDVGDAQMASQARLNSQGLRMLFPHASDSKTTVIFLNQVRSKIGSYGDPDISGGGRALGFYARVRLKTSRSKGEDGVSMGMSYKVIKGTFGKKGCEGALVKTAIQFGEGIDRIGEIIDVALEHGIVKKSGSWFSYGGNNLAQGKPAVKDLLKSNEDLLKEIWDKVEEAER